MNKLGIWTIVIAGAFLIGILSANPVVEAVGGWQGAFDNLQLEVTERDTTLVQLGGFLIADVILACDEGEKAVGSAIQSAIPNTFARTRIIVDAPNNDNPNISQWEMKIENPSVNQFISFNVSVICVKLNN